jgi:hypothetical protein
MSWVEGEIWEGGFMVLESENRWLWYQLLATQHDSLTYNSNQVEDARSQGKGD